MYITHLLPYYAYEIAGNTCILLSRYYNYSPCIYLYSVDTIAMNDRRGHGKSRLTSRKHFKPKPWHTVTLQRRANAEQFI